MTAVANDHWQLTNLAGRTGWRKTREELSSRLRKYLVATGDPRQRGEAPWDGYPFVDGRIFKNPNWRTEGLARPVRKRK